METSLSLIDRLTSNPSSNDWERLVAIYKPLLRSWLTTQGVNSADADDVVQDVLLCVSQELAGFAHNGREGAFRGWLKAILINRVRRLWAARRKQTKGTGRSDVLEMLNQLCDDSSTLSQQWDVEHDRHVLYKLLEGLRPQFSETHWQAFQLTVFEEVSIQEAAKRLSITPNTVYIARSRILKALRTDGQHLLE